MNLDEVLASLSGLPPDQRRIVEEQALTETQGLYFTPFPGPQTEALNSKADILFYGGAAGGGKSALLIGNAIDNHQDSIVFRRDFSQIKGLKKEAVRLLGSTDGYNSQDKIWNLPNGHVMEFGSVQHEDDKEKYQGRAHSFKGFDEITGFTESQFRFLIGWLRDTDLDQRCRVICAGNPPMTDEGAWVIKFWGPWLDPTHPNPAAQGELRWFTTVKGEDQEMDGPGPHLIDGKWIKAKSRSFIQAKLEDNPALLASGYADVLEAMPEPMRTMLREGRFDIAAKDDPWQVIPMQWILAAQGRWTSEPPKGVAMTAMGFDPAGGGEDAAVLATRYGGWYAPLVTAKGPQTKDGNAMAALVLQARRDQAPVIVDMGGGFGGSVTLRMADNGIDHIAFNGATQSAGRTLDGSLSFVNKRAEAYWRFREALDPHQDGGSVIALPPDPELRSDLAAVRWDAKPNGILLRPKEQIRERLGRSPGKGDAVVYALSTGEQARQKMARRAGGFGMSGGGHRMPTVNIGYSETKKHYRR